MLWDGKIYISTIDELKKKKFSMQSIYNKKSSENVRERERDRSDHYYIPFNK